MDAAHPELTDARQISERDLLEATLNIASDLIVVLDRQARIVRFNRACERLTGYRAAEVAGQPFWDLFLLPDERARVQRVFARLCAGRCPSTCENHWLTRRGERRLIAWTNTALLDARGAVEYVIGAGIDITARQQGEARLRAIFENAAIGITLADLERRIVACNPAYERFVGYRGAELRRGRYPMATHIDDVPEDRRLYHELVSGQRDSYQLEKRYLRKDGKVVWGRLTASLVRDTAGTPQYTVGMIEDITARKQAERLLHESEAQFRLILERATLGLRCVAEGQVASDKSAADSEMSAPPAAVRQPPSQLQHDTEALSLTAREREILALIATAQTSDAIAARLGIAARTVEFHIRNLFAKLGAHSRIEALYIAQQRGVLHAEEPNSPPS